MRALLALLLVTAAVACSHGRGAPRPAEARRVVSVTPSTTEAMYAIGAGDRVVGRSRFCDWPAEAKKLPVVGGFVDVDIEAILQLGPDLVVGASGPASARLAEQLGSRGIATWFPPVDSFAEIDEVILGLGARTRHEAEARRAAATIDGEAAAVERAVAGEPRPRVLVVLGLAPVVAAGPHDFLDEMVRRAGATNALLEGGPWQTLGLEEIIRIDPDVIVDASVMGTGRPSAVTAQAPGWKDVRAARQGRVVAVSDPRVLRPGPRVAEGLAVLARALHPRAPVPVW